MKRSMAWILPLAMCALAGAQAPRFTPAQKKIEAGLGMLRKLGHAARARQTLALALTIRALPPDGNQRLLALELATLSTEGDFGRATLQQVTTTLDRAIAATPPAPGQMADTAYQELASLERYEGMQVGLHTPAYEHAVAQLAADDAARADANFTLRGVDGRTWTLGALRGKVVLVNFWATWCPPCRAEMPDLERLQREFGPRGLVVLGISDETPGTVQPFLIAHGITYPVLLDPGDRVEKLYRVGGIPMSVLYGRGGGMVAEAMDMRTRGQLLAMLARAGLRH